MPIFILDGEQDGRQDGVKDGINDGIKGGIKDVLRWPEPRRNAHDVRASNAHSKGQG
jgi:hypothetical protein